MSERRWSVVSLAIALAVAAPRPAAAEPVTLDDAIARALAAHPSLAGARARVDAAATEIALVDVEARPTVAATASYSVGARAGIALTDPAQALAGSVTASWRIWDFGLRAARRRAAAATVAAREVAFTQAERAVLQQVEQAYVDVLGAEARLQIRRAASVAERRHLDEARRLVVAGSKTSIDVAQADARVASARVAEVRADNARAQAIAALAQAIAGDLPADATFTTPWPAPLVDEDAALEGLVAEAVRADPELARLNAERLASARAREATRLATRPTLAATASAGVDALGTYGVPPDDRRVAGAWSAGVTLSWQLYDGGARRARLRAADATLRAADAELADRLLGLRAQLSAARLDIAAAKAQQGAAAASVAAAREQLRQAEARSAAGLGTSAELTDAQDALTQALGDAADADYQLAAARTILRYRLGRLVTHPGHRESNP